MQQLPGMTQGTVSEHLRAQPPSSDGSPDNTFTNFNASVYTTSDFSHHKWIRVSSGWQSATLQKQRANPSLSGTLVVPSRPRHEITVSSSNSCNQQSAAHRLESRTALGTLLLLNTTQVPGVTPGSLNTSIELHWRCSRTLRSIKGLFLIQETCFQKQPRWAGNQRKQQHLSKGPLLSKGILALSLSIPGSETSSEHLRQGHQAWLRGQHSKAGCPPRHHYMQAPPPADLRNMLTATILLGGCAGTEGGTPNLEHSHMSVQLEVRGLVTQGEIILWQFGFGCVKTHLIASKPTFKGQHSPAIDGWSWKIYINITAKTETIPFIWGLQFPTLLSVKQTKTTWAFTAV